MILHGENRTSEGMETLFVMPWLKRVNMRPLSLGSQRKAAEDGGAAGAAQCGAHPAAKISAVGQRSPFTCLVSPAAIFFAAVVHPLAAGKFSFPAHTLQRLLATYFCDKYANAQERPRPIHPCPHAFINRQFFFGGQSDHGYPLEASNLQREPCMRPLQGMVSRTEFFGLKWKYLGHNLLH